MLKLVAACALLGALTAGVLLLPIHGRTVADRWHAAPDPAAFARSAWVEARHGPLPVEHHTADDRASLDRLLSERSR